MAPVVSMKELLEGGVHFGHQTRRWNPKMKRFIYGDRHGIYIIDLKQTLKRIETAYSFVRDLVADGGSVLFVGTKRQAQDPIQSYAEKCGMPYVNERWLGGMLTNYETMAKRVGKMQEYQRMRDSGEFDVMPKKEALLLTRELTKLERNLGGIRNMEKLPVAVFILDTNKEHIAVTEANKLGLPIVAVVDTNCDPDVIQYVIPGNDDAIRSGTLMCRIISDAVQEGRFIASRRHGNGSGPSRSAAEEEEIAAQQAEARRQAAAAQRERDARLATSSEPAAGDANAGGSPAGEPSEASAATVGAVDTLETLDTLETIDSPAAETVSEPDTAAPNTPPATTTADPTPAATDSTASEPSAAMVGAVDTHEVIAEPAASESAASESAASESAATPANLPGESLPSDA